MFGRIKNVVKFVLLPFRNLTGKPIRYVQNKNLKR